MSNHLREYQLDAFNRGVAALDETNKRDVFVMATGSGKSTVIAELAKYYINEYKNRLGRKVLIYVHRMEIVNQLVERLLMQSNGELSVSVYNADSKDMSGDVIVASKQSITENSIFENIGLLLPDESHHDKQDNDYARIEKQIFSSNQNVKKIGFTATLFKSKIPFGFDRIIYKKTADDLIIEGWLVPIVVKSAQWNFDREDKEARQGFEQNLPELALKFWLESDHKQNKTLAFFRTIEQSKTFNELALKQGIKSAHIDGLTKDRDKLLNFFKTGQLDVITNVGIFGEGVDIPDCRTILFARNSQSDYLLTQVVGRVMRLSEGKHYGLFLDVYGNDYGLNSDISLSVQMKVCPECGGKIFKAMTICPLCNTVFEKRFKRNGQGEVVATSLSAEQYMHEISYSSVFSKLKSAWFEDNHYLSASLGIDNGSLLIIPPLKNDITTVKAEFYELAKQHDKDMLTKARLQLLTKYIDLQENYTLWSITPVAPNNPIDKRKLVRYHCTGLDLQDSLRSAETLSIQIGDKSTSKRKAKWRSDSNFATDKQIAFMKKLGYNGSNDVSKGYAAQYITHVLSIQEFNRYLQGLETNIYGQKQHV